MCMYKFALKGHPPNGLYCVGWDIKGPWPGSNSLAQFLYNMSIWNWCVNSNEMRHYVTLWEIF